MHSGWADEGSETARGVHFIVILEVCAVRSGEVAPGRVFFWYFSRHFSLHQIFYID
jgi:hypothetical protein